MSFQSFVKVLDFLFRPEVATIYSAICNMERCSLEEALRNRGLDTTGDASMLRVKLLCTQMKVYYPSIHIPHYLEDKLTPEDASLIELRIKALSDITRTFFLGKVNGSPATPMSLLQPSQASMISSFHDVQEDRLPYRAICINLMKTYELHYDGTKGLPAQEFLARLEDFRVFSTVNEHVLIAVMPAVFDTSVLEWYRTKEFPNWEKFVADFTEEYVNVRESTVHVQPRHRNERNGRLNNKESKRFNVSQAKALQEMKNSLIDSGLTNCDRKPSSPASKSPSQCSSVLSTSKQESTSSPGPKSSNQSSSVHSISKQESTSSSASKSPVNHSVTTELKQGSTSSPVSPRIKSDAATSTNDDPLITDKSPSVEVICCDLDSSSSPPVVSPTETSSPVIGSAITLNDASSIDINSTDHVRMDYLPTNSHSVDQAELRHRLKHLRQISLPNNPDLINVVNSNQELRRAEGTLCLLEMEEPRSLRPRIKRINSVPSIYELMSLVSLMSPGHRIHCHMPRSIWPSAQPPLTFSYSPPPNFHNTQHDNHFTDDESQRK